MTEFLSEWWWIIAVFALIVFPGMSLPKKESDEES
jgi:hypothetical protein